MNAGIRSIRARQKRRKPLPAWSLTRMTTIAFDEMMANYKEAVRGLIQERYAKLVMQAVSAASLPAVRQEEALPERLDSPLRIDPRSTH